jgi:predicted PurR-regulated permease PerM
VSNNRAPLFGFLATLLFFVTLAVIMVLPYLEALIVGGIMATLSWRIARRFRRYGTHAAAAIVTLGMIIVVVGPSMTFAALAVKQGIQVFQHVTAQSVSMTDIGEWIMALPGITYFVGDVRELQSFINDSLSSITAAATAWVLRLAATIPGLTLNVVLACLACFFFLADGERFVAWVSPKLPVDVEIFGRLRSTFQDSAISVVWASMAAALVQGLIMLFAYAVLRVPAAFLAFGATFILAWIPVAGCTPVWVVGAGYLYLNGEPTKVAIMIVLGLITGISDNFVRPAVLRGRGEMHPLVSLVAMFGGIHMFGILGVILGPILAALVITLLQVWPTVGARFGLNFPLAKPEIY